MTRRSIIIAVAALAASACNIGADTEERDPGSSVSRSYQIGAFDRIEVGQELRWLAPAGGVEHELSGLGAGGGRCGE